MYLSPSLSISLCVSSSLSIPLSVCLPLSTSYFLSLSLSGTLFLFLVLGSLFFGHKKVWETFRFEETVVKFQYREKGQMDISFDAIRWWNCHDEISQFKSEKFNGISWSTTAIAPTDSISFAFISSPGIKLAKLLLHSS